MAAKNIVGKHIIASTPNPLAIKDQTSYISQIAYCATTLVDGWKLFIRDKDTPQKVIVLLYLYVTNGSPNQGVIVFNEPIQMLNGFELASQGAVGAGILDIWLHFDTAPLGSV